MEYYDYDRVDKFIESCQEISIIHDTQEAFELISERLDNCPDRYLNDFVSGLNYVQHEKTLDWIEKNIERIKNIPESWGHLAASSNFTWERATYWLSLGRPLSLIALDGLMFCTSVGPRLNQSLWMRELNPRLPDQPSVKILREVLMTYREKDNVHRTRKIIDKIIQNAILLDEGKNVGKG